MQKLSSASTPLPRTSEAFFQAGLEGFERAAENVGETFRYDYQLGGYPIRLCFASPLLAAKILPPFAHRATLPVPPALTICLWDSATTRSELPSPLRDVVSAAQSHWVGILGPRGEIEECNDARFRAAYLLGPGNLALLDTERNLALYWVENAAELPYYEQASPLKTILGWWMDAHARQLVHAAAIGTADRGVLVVGKGGMGKSSTALACLGSPLKIVSDDYALIATDPEPYVYSLYNTAKLGGQPDLERFPHLRPHIHNLERLGQEKLMLFLQAHYAEQLCPGFPIRAVLVPRVTGRVDTTILPETPGAALMALSLTTLFQRSGSGQTALSLMAALLRRVPCYALALGTDMTQIPRVLSRVLSL